MVRTDQDRIGGTVGKHAEVDETYVGGKTRDEGRGVHHKTLVAATVEVYNRKSGTVKDKQKDGRYAGRVGLAFAPDRSAELLCGFVRSAYGSLQTRGYEHHAIAKCGDPEVVEVFMPIILLAFSNLKTWINAIHHGVSAKYLQAHLNEFTFCFNRRFHPFNVFLSLPGIAGGAEGPTYAKLFRGLGTLTCSEYGH